MPTLRHLLIAWLAVTATASAQIVQTFEPGEDTSDWGSAGFNNGSVTSTFLAESFGGTQAGGGASLTQTFDRSFRNNSVGLNVETQRYFTSMYVQVDTIDGASSAQFEILDGSFGTNNAGNIRVFTDEVTPGVYEFRWQARDNNTGWQDIGIDMMVGEAYFVAIVVDPTVFTYEAWVGNAATDGSVSNLAIVEDLAFDSNVINNDANGVLTYYIQASSGNLGLRVDNILIAAGDPEPVPEPAACVLLMLGALAVLARRRT